MAKRQDDLSQLNAGAKEEEMEELDSLDNEELDFDEFLDWRAKISWSFELSLHHHVAIKVYDV